MPTPGAANSLATGEAAPELSEIVTELPHGPSVAQLVAAGRPTQTYVFTETEQLPRRDFFYAEPIDLRFARFGALFTDPDFRSYTAWAMTTSALSGATVLGSSGLVALDGELLHDSLQSIQAWRAETIVGDADGKKQRLKRPVQLPGLKLAGAWFHVFTGAWPNYAHWMTECMPKLLLFCWLREHVPNLQLLLPEFGHSRFHIRTLELLGLSNFDASYLGDDDIIAPEVLWLSPVINIWGVQPLCRIAAQHMAAVVMAGEAAATLPMERIYIHRQTSLRQVLDFDSLLPVLQSFGFTVVSFETMTLDSQISSMQRARYVIGEHGAGMANLMFCCPGTRVLELFNPACVQPEFWVLSSLCNVDYGYMVGRHIATPDQPEPNWNSDYAISPEQLWQGIRALVGHASAKIDTNPNHVAVQSIL